MNEFEVCREAASNHDIVFLFSETGVYVKIWTKDSGNLAFDADELLGKRIIDAIPGEAGRGLNQFVVDVFKSNKECPITYSIDTLGGLQWFKGLARPVEINNERYVLFTTNNITDIKKMSETIDDQNKQFSSILESIPGAVVRATYDYQKQALTIPFVSNKASELFRLEKYTPHYLYSLLSEEDRDSFMRAINKALVTQKPLHWRGKFTDKFGELQHIGVQALCTEDNESVSIWDGIVFDITDRVNLEEKLEYAREQKAKQARLESIGELAAGLGHEINNPLTIIYGYLNQLKKNNPDDELTLKVIDKCLQASDRIKDIVGDLKGLHPDHYVSKQIKDVHIDKLIDETVRIFHTSYKKDGIDLSFNPIDKNLWIKADAAKIQQVLFHTLANAKCAVEDSDVKKIQITTRIIGSKFLSLEIKDTGHGIDEKHRNKIYDAFFTTHINNFNKGLGLSIVSNIIQKHQGSIHFENNNDAVGTTFFIRLPLAIPLKKHA